MRLEPVLERIACAMPYTKETIAANIAALRQSAGMTQAEFAGKLNYTDKAVSKWERAESVPDVFVLAEIAELFGVTVDYLLAEHDNVMPETTQNKHYSRIVVSLLSVTPVWLAAVIAYSVCEFFTEWDRLWLIYAAAVPLTLIVLLVFNCIWGRPALTYVIVSLLMWSVLGFIYLLFIDINYWLLFTVGIPGQLAVILWSRIKK